MTNQEAVSEALYELKYAIEDLEMDDECPAVSIDTIEVSIEALEKQIPHRAVNIRKGEVFKIGYCPRCKEGLSEEFKYCLECGQAIDWSEEVEE